MYGGNNKSLQQITQEVKATVLGQDNTVDKLCAFVDMVSTRAKLINEGYEESLALPPLSSALIVGPTASGKSHMLKTFADKAGMICRAIDASSMSTEGYKGASFSTEWHELSQELALNPGQMAVVLIDEVDKLLIQTNEGNAKFDLLKPLEGGILTGHAGRCEDPFELPCDRCVFILAGAFTGIDAIVAKRLRIDGGGCGFNSGSKGLPADQKEREALLRNKMTLEDIEAWGCPRELVGRISQVWPMSALSEETLRGIVTNNKRAEYQRMLGGAEFEIGEAAVDLIVKRALEHNYGARSVNQQIASVFVEKVWPKIAGCHDINKVQLIAADEELDCVAWHGNKAISSVPAVEGRLSEKRGYALLDEVHQRCLEAANKPLDASAFDEGATDFAASLLQAGNCTAINGGKLQVANDYSLAEITLVHALYAYIKDWCADEDQTPYGFETLLNMWSDVPDHNSTPLSRLFSFINNGISYNSTTKQWEKHMVRRNSDGVAPGKVGGLAPSEDKALGYYHEFCGYPAKSQKEAVHSLAFRLLQLEHQRARHNEAAVR